MAPSSIKEGGGEKRAEQHQAKTLSPLPNFINGEDQGVKVTHPVVYQRTPLHTSMPAAEACTTAKTSTSSSSRRAYDTPELEDKTVSCNTCRPTGREKISIVPVEANGSGGMAGDGRGQTGTNVFKSLLFSIARKSPKWGVGCDQSPLSSPSTVRSRDDQRNAAVNELTQKLVAANRRRDEALAEVARLRTSMGELERKLGKLEVYCHDLKKALDARIAEETTIGGVVAPEAATAGSGRHKKQGNPVALFGPRDAEAARTVESFLQAVSDSRACVRHLGKSLASHLGQMGTKAFERLTALLSPYDVRISPKSSRAVVFYLEALLSRALYEDFETPAFERSAPDAVLNPTERCRANLDAYTALKALSWEEVLSKGTRRFSESFSRFCDQKMSAIMGMLGWSKAWPEPLLQAFFGAAKHVWLVHLLAFAFHPSLPIFRVDKGAGFDGLYMEDIAGDKLLLKKNTTTSGAAAYAVVRIMVSPGFYVHSNVVKCKVLCRYQQQQQQQG
ncbi:IRK-interacting protein [Nymphaea colorata]|nr:IRK-interacting protein [Nymphaea colorata]